MKVILFASARLTSGSLRCLNSSKVEHIHRLKNGSPRNKSGLKSHLEIVVKESSIIAQLLLVVLTQYIKSAITTNCIYVWFFVDLCCSTEEGLYYGVNLREDNFLMMRARLRGKHEPITDLDREEVGIPSEVISGTYKELFDYIALKLAVFISINTKTNPIAPKGKMGFTVSFPLHDGPAAAGANVIRWKSFPVNEAVEFSVFIFTFYFLIDSIVAEYMFAGRERVGKGLQ